MVTATSPTREPASPEGAPDDLGRAGLVREGSVSARSSLGSRVGEFLVTGGITLFLFPLSWLLRKGMGLSAAEYAVGFTMFHAAHVINDPHFAVTYLLFYEDAKKRAFGAAFPPLQRARYILAGVVAPLALVGWVSVALIMKSAVALGLLIQLMFLLVGWHYVKQIGRAHV